MLPDFPLLVGGSCNFYTVLNIICRLDQWIATTAGSSDQPLYFIRLDAQSVGAMMICFSLSENVKKNRRWLTSHRECEGGKKEKLYG